MSDTVIDRGWWVKGTSAGRGVMVVTPRCAGFVPTERPKSIGVELVWGVAGFVTLGARKIPPERVIEELRTGDLETQLERLSAGLHGRIWRPSGTTIFAKKILLRRKHRGLWLQNGNESIRLARAVPVDELERLRTQWAAWTWT